MNIHRYIAIPFIGIAIASTGMTYTLYDKYQERTQALIASERLLEASQRRLEACADRKPREIIKYRRSLPTGVYEPHLRNIIHNVLVYLEVKNPSDWERLLYLTACVESDGGRYTRQVKGPARGFFQTERPTEKDSLKWCKIKHPDLYEKIKKLRIPAHLDVHETEYNVAYATALAYLEYFWRKVDPTDKSMEQLAYIHKKYYNTYLGKATIKNSIAKITAMNVRLGD